MNREETLLLWLVYNLILNLLFRRYRYCAQTFGALVLVISWCQMQTTLDLNIQTLSTTAFVHMKLHIDQVMLFKAYDRATTTRTVLICLISMTSLL